MKTFASTSDYNQQPKLVDIYKYQSASSNQEATEDRRIIKNKGAYYGKSYEIEEEIYRKETFTDTGWQGSSTTTRTGKFGYTNIAKGKQNSYSWTYSYSYEDADTAHETSSASSVSYPIDPAHSAYTINKQGTSLRGTMSFQSQYYQKGVRFTKSGNEPYTFQYSEILEKTSSSSGLEINYRIFSLDSLSLTRRQCDPYDVLAFTAYAHEPKRIGGILTAKFEPENLFDWEDFGTDDLYYEEIEFSHVYQTLEKSPAAGNNTNENSPYPYTNKKGYTLHLKTTQYSFGTINGVNSEGLATTFATYSRNQVMTVFSASEITLNAGLANGQVFPYTYLLTYLDKYAVLGIANSKIVTIDATFENYTFAEGSYALGNSNYQTPAESRSIYTENGNRWLINAVGVHGYSPHTVIYQVFESMICPITMQSFDPGLIFYRSFVVNTFSSSSSRGATFKAAVPIYNIAENVSHIVSEMYFVSKSTIDSTRTTTLSNRTYEYLYQSASYNFSIKQYQTFLTKKTRHIPQTTLGTVETLYSYDFKITSSEGISATFLETRYDHSSQTVQRFSLRLASVVQNPFNYTSSSIYLSNKNNKIYFRLGGCCDHFSVGREVKIMYGFGFWDYSKVNNSGDVKEHQKTEIVIYRDLPSFADIDPKMAYVFRHTPKKKIGWYPKKFNNPDTANLIESPATFLGYWGGFSYINYPTSFSNLHYEETDQGVGWYQRTAWSQVLSTKRNQYKDYVSFTS